jgi:hypothetical protein
MEPKTQIDTASVKVMRSHDYCHFEVCLSSSSANTPELVDELRKTAARLSDKAVEQYKVMKSEAEKCLSDKFSRDLLVAKMKRIEETPEGERTVRDQAELKAYKDEPWKARDRYDYDDQWDDGDHV